MVRTADAIRLSQLQQRFEQERQARLKAEARLNGTRSALLRAQAIIARQRADAAAAKLDKPPLKG